MAAPAHFILRPARQLSTTSRATLTTLSNNNLSVAGTGAGSISSGSMVQTVPVQSGRQIYFEGTANTISSVVGDLGVGLVTAAHAYTAGNYLGNDTTSGGYYDDGNFVINNVVLFAGQTFVATNVIGIAIIGGSKMWSRVNGGNWNNAAIGSQNPATNTGGYDISSLGATTFIGYCVDFNTTAGKWTFNFGATAFGTAAPSGFFVI